MNTFYRYLLLFALNLLATSEFHSLYTAMADEAISVVCAQRMLLGEFPYRDFSTDITPGIYVIGALWFKLFGVSGLSIRLLSSAIFATTSVLIQACSERVFTGYWRYLPWLLWTTGGVMEFPVLNHHWLGGCFVLLSWYFALGWCRDGGRRERVGLGAALALSLWALQSEGLAATLGVVFVWARLRPAGLGQVVASAVGFSLLIWLPFLPYFQQVLQANVLGIGYHVSDSYNRYSLQNLQEFLSHYAGLSPVVGWLPFLAALSHIFINLLRYITLPVLVLLALIGSSRRKNRGEQVLAWSFLAWVLSCSGRMTLLYVAFLNAGWVLVLVMVIRWIPRGWILAVSLATLEVSGWLLRGVLRQQLYQYPIMTRIGVYYTMDPAEAAGEAELGRWIADWLPPHTPVLAFPYAAQVYSLYELKNPVRQLIISPGATAPGVYAEVQRQLQDNKVEWLIYLDVAAQEVAGNFDVDPVKLSADWAKIRQQLTGGYELFQGGPRMGLYRRKNIR